MKGPILVAELGCPDTSAQSRLPVIVNREKSTARSRSRAAALDVPQAARAVGRKPLLEYVCRRILPSPAQRERGRG